MGEQVFNTDATAPGLYIRQAGTTRAALQAKGGGDLLDLRNASGRSVLRVSQRGGVPVLPSPAAGQYLLTTSQNTGSLTGAPTVGTLRLAPWVVASTISIDRIGGEVTTAGDAGAKLRPAIYADSGNCYPAGLLLDGGQLAADGIAVVEGTVSLTLTPGLYWIGGVTQDTVGTVGVRSISSSWTPEVALSLGTSAPAAASQPLGFQQTSVTSTLPAVFTATLAVNSGVIPRIFVRVA
jgi:hypothetical protein